MSVCLGRSEYWLEKSKDYSQSGLYCSDSATHFAGFERFTKHLCIKGQSAADYLCVEYESRLNSVAVVGTLLGSDSGF